jgi:hypothetical protein
VERRFEKRDTVAALRVAKLGIDQPFMLLKLDQTARRALAAVVMH